jgi:hypothetical protein
VQFSNSTFYTNLVKIEVFSLTCLLRSGNRSRVGLVTETDDLLLLLRLIEFQWQHGYMRAVRVGGVDGSRLLVALVLR